MNAVMPRPFSPRPSRRAPGAAVDRAARQPAPNRGTHHGTPPGSHHVTHPGSHHGARCGARRAALIARVSAEAIVGRVAQRAPHVARMLARTATDWELVSTRQDADPR